VSLTPLIPGITKSTHESDLDYTFI